MLHRSRQKIALQGLAKTTQWIALLDAHCPLTIKKRLLEPQLNRIFETALQDGEFDLLEGRFLQLEITNPGICLTLTQKKGRLCISQLPGQAKIRGDWRAFLQLALKREDPDGLFFRRQLLLEGDTELGLGIKNLLDSLDWSLEQGLRGRLLQWLEKLSRRIDDEHQPGYVAAPSMGKNGEH